jgi:hypothetical protein
MLLSAGLYSHVRKPPPLSSGIFENKKFCYLRRQVSRLADEERGQGLAAQAVGHCDF